MQRWSIVHGWRVAVIEAASVPKYLHPHGFLKVHRQKIKNQEAKKTEKIFVSLNLIISI